MRLVPWDTVAFPRLFCGLVMTTLLMAGTPPLSGEEGRQPGRDRHGDPLPAGARARLGTVHLRHGGSVRALAFSPDGKTLASGSWDGSARLWDATTGKELRRIVGHRAGVEAVAFSPDGKLLATSGRYTFKDAGDHTVRLWYLSTGKLLRTLDRSDDHSDLAGHYLAFSADGKLLVGGSESTIHLWEASTGNVVSRRTLRGCGGIHTVVFAPDGTFLALGTPPGREPEAVLWDARTGKVLGRFQGHQEHESFAAVSSLALSPDGKILATGGQDRTVRLWDRATGKQLRQLSGFEDAVHSLAFSPDGKLLASGSWLERCVHVIAVGSGERVHRLAHPAGALSIAFSPDGKTLATGTYDQVIRLWDTSSGRQRLREGLDEEVLSLALLPGGKRIATVGPDGAYRVWDTESGEELRGTRLGSIRLIGASLSANGDRLATVHTGEKDWLSLWDVSETGLRQRQLGTIPRPEWGTTIALSPDGRTLLAGDWSSVTRLYLWDLTRDAGAKPLVRKVPWEDERDVYIAAIVFSADSKWAAVAMRESDAWLVSMAAFKAAALEARKAEQVGSIIGGFFLSSLALSANGSTLAVGTCWNPLSLRFVKEQKAVYVCDTADPYERRPFGLHKERESVDSVAFSPDGKVLAAGRRDGTILLWDMKTAKVRRSLQGHQGPVQKLTFSADGSILASAGADTTVLIWPLQTP